MRQRVATFEVEAGRRVRLACTARQRVTVTLWGEHGEIGPYPLVPFVPMETKDGKPQFVKPYMAQFTGHHDFVVRPQHRMRIIAMVEDDGTHQAQEVRITHVREGRIPAALHAFGRLCRDAGWAVWRRYAGADRHA